MKPYNIKEILDRIQHDRMQSIIQIDAKKSRDDKQLLNWINSFGVHWDIACCWHQPKGMEGSAKYLQKTLTKYFRGLNRIVFKGVKGVVCELPRFITFEKKGEVGWHAHGMIATPTHIDPSALINLMETEWRDRNSDHSRSRFVNQLFWGQLIQNNYAAYSIKNISPNMYKRDGDETAFVDVFNTYRP